jgi:glycosyltransferase involved in cell wall biosynthesis
VNRVVPRVTVIIPTYNRARLVSRSIESVLRQSYSDVDVIVVDDGSTDNTAEVLAEFEKDPRVRLVRHDGNRGVTAALNTGIALLPELTKYFGVLGSDDALLRDGVEALVRVFEASGDMYSMVLGWCRNIGTGTATGAMTHLPGGTGIITYDDALAGRYVGDFWHLARRDLIGDLRFEERAMGGEGSVWWRLLRARPGRVVPDVVSEVDTSSADRLSRPGYTHREAVGMMWVHQAMLDAVGNDLRRSYPRVYGSYMTEMAKWGALAGDGRKARAASRQGLRFAPSRRALFVALMALAPYPVLRWVAESRSRRHRHAERPA